MSLEQMLAAPLPFELVPVPEFGDDAEVRLNAISGLERQRLATQNSASETTADRIDFQHDLIATSLGDDATPEQVARLPGAVIDRLGKVALRMAGIGEQAIDEATAALNATPSGDGGSA
jgi:hypothetical protein